MQRERVATIGNHVVPRHRGLKRIEHPHSENPLRPKEIRRTESTSSKAVRAYYRSEASLQCATRETSEYDSEAKPHQEN